ncbi:MULTISPECIES: hypothetical protein [Paenarthrobacter]|uniref:Uncharacterized protein n=2 Tax=Paenarthrobacter TaxID=1742992 RepID=A0AAX3ERH4_PAEUR|nr:MULTISPECIES: hypothetical protein [Paenarthrobacter]MCX8456564.1 hypothetical protein [Paenarthrobacter ureafaciens]MCY0974427.1 hypothetical protein [Paenarthrobacter ureafaciens]MDO5877984.1 hypothetical protein [Paenarthrobacter sp. SD-1]UYV95379.1 hypothetical protein NL395_22570 [Paenarthrobacter ureafaciens]UYV99937.1 hypothetical protein NL394_22125 [Paenarthrobacter ureafaciens]
MKGSAMGWFTEGSDHEGYVVCVFADGMYGAGGKHRQISLMAADGRTIWENGNDPDSVVWRPPSQVVGWKVACSCEPHRKHIIMDQLWTRVWDPAEEDLTGRRIYAGDPSSDDAAYVSDREDLEPLFIEQWHQHIAPELHLRTISALGEQLKQIEAQLDKAVAAARSDGLSWDKIGRAFGITRQGARSRWDTQAPGQEL